MKPLPSVSQGPERLESIDLLRGLVMVLMALDHTRDFFSNATFDPSDLAHTTPAYFLTRWVTHFCAPVFIFLAGIGAFLAKSRGKTAQELSWFLLTRGLWLVLLELTYVNWFGWQFRVDLHHYYVQVIWAIGWSMVALAALVWFPRWAVMTFGLMMIVLHNLTDAVKPKNLGGFADVWRVLHVPGGFDILPGIHFMVTYPLIPWMGVMAAGFAFGPVLLQDERSRRKWLLIGGSSLSVLFIVLRATNLYGDPVPWEPQKNFLFTILSFLDCCKYPPSLCYLLMTLGPALLVLAMFDRGTPKWLRPLLVFGRVPLFFYLIHLPLIHVLLFLANTVGAGIFSAAPGAGLAGVYLFWIMAVALLFPVCRWFAGYKQRHRSVWLSYL